MSILENIITRNQFCTSKLTGILQFQPTAILSLRRTLSPSIIKSMNQPFHLYRLQQIDLQIDRAEVSLASLNRLLSGDETIREAAQAVEEAGKTLHLAQQKLKQTEFSVRDQQLKIAQSEAKLYSGKLHNPKELQDLQKEIASLKKHLSVLEDLQLEAMMKTEESEEAAAAAQKSLVAAQAAFSEKSAGWSGQKEQELHILERLRSERDAALTLVTPDSIQTYTFLRRRKSGVAVTTAKDGSCTVCGATIRPSELQEARTAQVFVYCGSCGRILYTG